MVTWRQHQSGDASHVVLSDGQESIYLLSLQDDPQPRLFAEHEAPVGAWPLTTRLAVLGNLVGCGAENGKLALFKLPSLEPQPPLDIKAQITWGPFPVGEHALCATDTDELLCIDAEGQLAWKTPLAHGAPAGRPLLLKDQIALLWKEGSYSQLNLNDGQESSHIDFDHPVIAGPVPWGENLVVTAFDGTLLLLAHP